MTNITKILRSVREAASPAQHGREAPHLYRLTVPG
jgi:hypothetical protein